MSADRSTTLFPLFLVLYEVACYLSNDAYLPALPQLVHYFHTTESAVQLTLTAWFLGTSTTQLIVGPLSDRYGRKPFLTGGGGLFILSTLGCAFAPNILLLLILRFFQGVAITFMAIPGYAAIHELLDHDRAINTLGWMNSITTLAPAMGPLVGSLILSFTRWQWIFIILALWAALALAGIYKVMPETKPKEKREFKKVAMVLKSYWYIASNKTFISYTLVFCCLFGAMISWITIGPFLIIQKFHYPTIAYAFFQVVVFGGFVIGTRLIKPLLKVFKAPLLIRFCLRLAVIGSCFSLVSSLILPRFLGGLIIGMLLITLAAGMTFPLLNRHAIESSKEEMGARVAVFSAIMSSFAMLASAIVSLLTAGRLLSFALLLVVFTLCGYGINKLTRYVHAVI